ncbi:DNA-3-methyladenine glycosylase 2 [Coralloluteibacterium stylophorae]|uniref:DNA-3-methyladenine glycosylase II n=1 Tax=Coralloluteibacterium stylophorae TaxID=1776034 RepID=A0A8J8AY37_9GAMM|nr:DNA-3-methyladenine glycosylase 2 [Coralloluteibacterium stylophorae]MBS7456337.1 DNA-3-methyladenine glycosylase 2 family protein [Coralloluteibacterium stylophorae]
MSDSFDTRYRAIASRDERYDGVFFTAVRTTGIYCRPSCPARTPRAENVRFFDTAAAAQAAGFRACRRCRPDATPGSSAWDVRADRVARALRLIHAGALDDAGVGALAARLAVSPRHLHREMLAEVGVGPLALARTRRAQTARLLLEATALPATEIAFVAGYGSVRQFNTHIREAYGCAPGALRARRPAAADDSGELALRLAVRRPYDARGLLAFLATRAVPGIEACDGSTYRRSLRLAHGTALVAVTPDGDGGYAQLRLRLGDLRDLGAAVAACRRLFDMDADPQAVAGVLALDPALAPLVAARPGLRVPGHVDGFELAVRAVLGQQVTVQGARTLAARLVARLGAPLERQVDGLTHLFPTSAAIAGDALSGLGLTGGRIRALHALANAVVEGRLQLDAGADRAATRHALLALPGFGAWTADYIAMRALGDPDAMPLTDLGLRNALRLLCLPDDPRSLQARAESWRPWRAYAALHLWAHLAAATPRPASTARRSPSCPPVPMAPPSPRPPAR